MNSAARTSTLRLLESQWGKLSDERSSAYDEWLSHVPVEEADMRRALMQLWESADRKSYLPTPAEILAQLRFNGLLGNPLHGVGDPRILHALRPSVETIARNLARLRDITFAEGLKCAAETFYAHAQQHDDDGATGPNTWKDLLATADQLLDEQERKEVRT